MNASTRLSMNGKSPMISTDPPFVLRLWFDRLTTLSSVERSKDERWVFQQNQHLECPLFFPLDFYIPRSQPMHQSRHSLRRQFLDPH